MQHSKHIFHWTVLYIDFNFILLWIYFHVPVFAYLFYFVLLRGSHCILLYLYNDNNHIQLTIINDFDKSYFELVEWKTMQVNMLFIWQW